MIKLLLFSGETLGVPIHVFGPETHMTAIVGMALGKKKIPPPVARQMTTANFLLPGGQVTTKFIKCFVLWVCVYYYEKNWTNSKEMM